ncbi:DUF1778 domain-containing protein [Siculibacillus lacustris]|uniref:DUF1778 domain-containing protein n=1 Tax=Siculibacillus lacustris TaxID=1549641 RepID=A0A4V2KSH5_9HYPH|nr:DUF1778 domain-containing protein [Siculibacillus lacustris]
MPIPRVSQNDLLAAPESVLTAAERQAVFITEGSRDRLALVPLPEYVRLSGRTLDGKDVDPYMAGLIARFHQEEPTRFTSTLEVDLEPELIDCVNAEAAAYGCSADVVVNAALQLLFDEKEAEAEDQKTERLTLDVSADDKQLLMTAAKFAHQSLNDFIVENAVAEAHRVLGSPDPALDAALARGIADAEAGRVRPVDEVFSELKARYANNDPAPSRKEPEKD